MKRDKLLILAVDDSPDVLKSVEAVLKNDYDVFKLPKPAELEKVLTRVTPDLFLLDYKMPGLSGFDLVPVIRGFKEHKDTPILFLTSARSLDHLSTAVALGACDFIVKPFSSDTLLEKIKKHIEEKN